MSCSLGRLSSIFLPTVRYTPTYLDSSGCFLLPPPPLAQLVLPSSLSFLSLSTNKLMELMDIVATSASFCICVVFYHRTCGLTTSLQAALPLVCTAYDRLEYCSTRSSKVLFVLLCPSYRRVGLGLRRREEQIRRAEWFACKIIKRHRWTSCRRAVRDPRLGGRRGGFF